MGTKMESIATCDADKKDLEVLYEAFSSAFSLEDIASAYCKAKWDVNFTAEILYSQQDHNSSYSCSTNYEAKDASAPAPEALSELEAATSVLPELSSNSFNMTTSTGTVSDVLGKEYLRAKRLTVESCEATKPLKLNSEDIPASEIWNEVPHNIAAERDDTLGKDMEEFIFQMLGNGFQLGIEVIREVLGHCGYDVNKSMERLLDLSLSSLSRSDDVIGPAPENPDESCLDQDSLICYQKVPDVESTQADGIRLKMRNGKASHRKTQNKLLPGEILSSLFTAPEPVEEKPKRSSLRDLRRPRVSGIPVDKPFEITSMLPKIVTTETQDDKEDYEDSYNSLRKAVKEYCIAMRGYYTASLEAFAKGDHVRANKLLEQGMFFKEKAREADEKSSQMLFKSRNDSMCIDLRQHKPSEALRLLRLQLMSLSGIPSIEYLKLVIGSNEEDPKGARKRRILQELEKESVRWTEEQNGELIVIRVEELNPSQFSFTKGK